jgi:hypothetical protein
LCIPCGDPQFKSPPAQVPGFGCTLHTHACWCCSAGCTAFRLTVCGQFTFCIGTAKPPSGSQD